MMPLNPRPISDELQKYKDWEARNPAVSTSFTTQELRSWSDALADVQCWFMGFRAAAKVLEQEISTPEDIGSLQDLRELKKRLDGLILPEDPRRVIS